MALRRWPDVRGLVGIDAGVLHQRVHLWRRLRAGRSPASSARRGPVQPRIDVAGAGNFKAGKAVDVPSAATISCAMIFGALRSLRAS